MKRSDLELIQRYFANTRPDMRTAPVVEHDTWRRIVTAIGVAFAGSPWAHLHNPEAWLHGTGAEVREPAPAPGEPYEVDGAWYNLTESEARARGLVPDPSEPCWRVPRGLMPDGTPFRDADSGLLVDAITGEWRAMTPTERAVYPCPPPVDPAEYQDARESALRRDYCRNEDPGHLYVCTRPRGHDGLHAAMRSSGVLLRAPWAATMPAPVARPRPAATCGSEYEDDDGNLHVCDREPDHDDECTDGDLTWDS